MGAAGRGGTTGADRDHRDRGRGDLTGNAGTTGTAGTGGSSGNEVFVGPNGNDSNAGTQASPRWRRSPPRRGRSSAGWTIWLLPGTNALTPTQTADQERHGGVADPDSG